MNVNAVSLDRYELENYLKPNGSPMDYAYTTVPLTVASAQTESGSGDVLSLDGQWNMMQGTGLEPYDYVEEVETIYRRGYELLDMSGAVATASSWYQGGEFFKPSNLLDDSFSNEASDTWINEGTNDILPWFCIDLGSVKTVNGCILYSFGSLEAFGGQNDSRLENTSGFAVCVSCDGTNFTEVKRVNGNSKAVCDVRFDADYDARYIKVNILQATQTAGDPWARIAEFKLYTPVDLAEEDRPVTDMVYNKLDIVGKTVTASSWYQLGDYFKPSNLTDGARESDATDAWISDGNSDRDPWFCVDLGYVYEVNGYTLYNFGSLAVINEEGRAENTRAFTVSVSENGNSWQVVDSVSDNTKSIVDVKFDRYYSARYIRVNISEANMGGTAEWCRIAEFEVYAKKRIFNPCDELSWDSAVRVTVPGSIHTGLMENGMLDDPYVGFGSRTAKEMSFKTWWMSREFEYSVSDGEKVSLVFDGICDRCDMWLNGKYLGFHQGMFGGPEYDVTDYVVNGTNKLIVRLYPAVEDWNNTVVYTAAYGWHYGDIPPVGIWRSVSVVKEPAVKIDSPFISTVSTDGTMDFYTELVNPYGGTVSGTLTGVITPKNFEGESYTFTYNVSSEQSKTYARLRFVIPDPALWWPNGIGDQNLYTLSLTFEDPNHTVSDAETVSFAVRTLEMTEVEGLGEDIDVYNWTFVINGKKIFMTGADWCSIDALMRFTEERYDRQLTLAKSQGIRFLRSWGPGLVETDTFYDLCDEYGICVLQEWPTSWDSYAIQPEEVLYDTIVRNTKRIRNHPSLVMYGGGNEGLASLSARVLNEIGRLTVETDGTRPWHRQDPYGDSSHNYDSFHGSMPTEDFITYEATFIGEYGIASMMNPESVARYATASEMQSWPIDNSNSIAWHCFVWNGSNFVVAPTDIGAMAYRGRDFMTVDSLDSLITGSQLAQVVGYRYSLERARASWPTSTGICYYKLTDVYNCASWATVDVYGVPKMAHYFVQDAYEPLTAVALFEELSYYGEDMVLPVYLLDDADRLAGKNWEVSAKVYNSAFKIVSEEYFSGTGSIDKVELLGQIRADKSVTASAPLFVVVELYTDHELQTRHYYFENYSDDVNSLFHLPVTTLTCTANGSESFTVTNTGTVPAVGVSFDCSAVSDTFLPDDNFFWLDPGESKTVSVNDTAGVTGVSCWNETDLSVTAVPSAVTGLDATANADLSVTLTWNASSDPAARGYTISRDGAVIAYTQTTTATYTDIGVGENETHSYSVTVLNNGGRTSDACGAVTVTTPSDTTAPAVFSAAMESANRIVITFTKPIRSTEAENVSHYTLTNGASVTAAVLSDDGLTVTLTVSGAQADRDYVLNVSGLRDASSSANTMAPYSTTVSASLRLYWNFDGMKDDAVYDVTGHAAKGLLRYADVVNSSADSLGKSILFNDVNLSAIGIRKTQISCTDTFTVSAFVRTTDNTSSMTVFSHILYPLAGHWQLSAYAGEPFFYTRDFYVAGSGSHEVQFGFGVKVSDGKWHHLAITFNAGTVTTYVDGRQTGIWRNIAGTMRKTYGEFSIGRLPRNTNRWLGTLDEIRLYERALSASEVSTLASAAASVPYIVLENETMTLSVGSAGDIVIADSSFANGFTYEADDTAVASVSNCGTVTALSAGTTAVSVKVNGTVYAVCQVTVTAATPSDGYTVNGQVTSVKPSEPTTVRLTQDGATVVSCTIKAQEGEGTVTQSFVLTGVPAGVYDLVVEKSGHLPTVLKGLAVSSSVDLRENDDAEIANLELIPGDINNDGYIDSIDLTLLTFDLCKGDDEAALPSTDINGDFYRDALDISLISYNVSAAAPVIVCDN